MFISPITSFKTNYKNFNSRFSHPEEQKENSPSFGGLTKALKNKIYIDGQKDIEILLQKKVKTNPVVGQLPNFIFKKLPKE